jgi:hypothetical protein
MNEVDHDPVSRECEDGYLVDLRAARVGGCIIVACISCSE